MPVPKKKKKERVFPSLFLSASISFVFSHSHFMPISRTKDSTSLLMSRKMRNKKERRGKIGGL
jgi:hypothetical protein